MFVNRNYKPKMIDGAINKAVDIPRDIALRKVVKPSHTKRPIAVVSWDPRLPPIDQIQPKHWRSMTHFDPHLKRVFPEPPMLGYKRPKNIREYLFRAKLPPLIKPGQTNKTFKMYEEMQKYLHNLPLH